MTTVVLNADQAFGVEYISDIPGEPNWSTFRNHAGNALGSGLGNIQPAVYTGDYLRPSAYYRLNRSFVRFTNTVPVGASIISATIQMTLVNSVNTFPSPVNKFAWGFYNHVENIQLSDFYDCMATSLTEQTDGADGTNYSFTLDPSIISGSYLQFVFREGYFDYENHTPSVASQYYSYPTLGTFTLTIIYSLADVTTLPGTNVTQTTATLNGQLNSITPGLNADCGFEWGTTTSYGNTTATVNLSSPAVFSQAISGLSVQQYHYRAFATVSGVTTYGSDVTLELDGPNVLLGLNQSIFTPFSSITPTDISQYVMDIKIQRGRMHELNSIQAGTATITVKNTVGRF